MLIKWRCHLSPTERHKLGAPAAWNCRDVRLHLARISFDQLGPERASALNAVETRFKLPPEQVDMLIDAGRDALKVNPVFRSFVKSLGAPPPAATPVASPGNGAQEAEAQ
jgi:NTE family protein